MSHWVPPGLDEMASQCLPCLTLRVHSVASPLMTVLTHWVANTEKVSQQQVTEG